MLSALGVRKDGARMLVHAGERHFALGVGATDAVRRIRACSPEVAEFAQWSDLGRTIRS
jgi:hypothetical protein